MKQLLAFSAAVLSAAAAVSCSGSAPRGPAAREARAPDGFDAAQAPDWTRDDFEFFLHGSMSTEVVPERALASFRAMYPDLFPGTDLSWFGLVETADDSPVGFSRREVAHLGGLRSYGLNCASCHVAEILAPDGGPAVRVVGTTGHFDAEAFLGSVIVAGWRTADPDAMRRFLAEYVSRDDPAHPDRPDLVPTRFARESERQSAAIAAAMAGHAAGKDVAGDAASGGLLAITPDDVKLDRAMFAEGAPPVDLAKKAVVFLKLFHNMRAALHIPDAPPTAAPPASGPGRNDAFGLLALELFNSPAPYAPVKYGVLFNAGKRPWVHWDGNTRSALGRNILASLGLGAPLVGRKATLDLPLVERHTSLTQDIRAPKYPWAVDADAAARGAVHYAGKCASCHDAPETDVRLHAVEDVGTDPGRARGFDAPHAELFNGFFKDVQIEGFAAPTEAPIRSTGKYWAPSLDGVWARSPYLHNGSVRTMRDLLTPPAARPKSFSRGSHVYDAAAMGFTDDGRYVVDSASPGSGNGGHAYGTDLDEKQKRDLIEFLRTK